MSLHVINAKNVLVADCAERKKVAVSFPPLLTDTSTRNVVKQFQSHINNVIADTNDVCTCCGLFIPFGTGTLLTKIHPEFVSAIEVAVIVDDDLDYCGRTDNSSHFCNTCYSIIIEKQISKFGSTNYINVLLCQKYPEVLNDLPLIKEAFIACAHSVISVIKLRPSIIGLTTSYHLIRGHTIILPQNLEPSLTILPSSNLAPHDVIHIALSNKHLHAASDICPFATVRRTRVLETLCLLKANNHFYKNIVINLDLLYL